jgi:hypothetical protein
MELQTRKRGMSCLNTLPQKPESGVRSEPAGETRLSKLSPAMYVPENKNLFMRLRACGEEKKKTFPEKGLKCP